MHSKTDLHVFHFRAALPLGGDLDAAFTGREIVDWVERFNVFDCFVFGNHPSSFFRISTKLPAGEYLDAISSLAEGLRPKFSGRLFKGIECDFLLKAKGKVSCNPGEKLLARYDPEVSLIAFHFHRTLTYASRFEIVIADLIAAFKWAIDSEMFNILAHPFDVLERVYHEDRRGFEEIANLAREKKVAFEINADKGFGEIVMAALIENGNFFSFGGDFHALSYWLKRDIQGLKPGKPRGFPEEALRRLLGLTAEVADKEKRYWKELDPLFWRLPYPSEEKRTLRNYAVRLYQRCYPDEKTFKRGLEKVVAKFAPEQREPVESYLQELHRIYTKWSGAPRKGLRMRLEKYFLEAPLTENEIGIYEQWLARAYDLGLKREQLLNNWDTPKLESFLKRK